MQKIEQTLKQYNVGEKSKIKLIRESADNVVYLIDGEQKNILRISKRLPLEDVRFEFEVVDYLSRQGCSVPNWILTNDGNYYTLTGLGSIAVMFSFVEGKTINPQEKLPTKEQYYQAGKSLGYIHKVGLSFASSAPRRRNMFSELERVLNNRKVFTQQFEGGPKFVKEVEATINFAKDNAYTEGLIHNDYRPTNTIFNGKKLSGVIDFDWSCIGAIEKDLALALVEWSFPDEAEKADIGLLMSFLEGYNISAPSNRELDSNLLKWIGYACLSEASTYFCDLAEDPNSEKRAIKSYMYRKYIFFTNKI